MQHGLPVGRQVRVTASAQVGRTQGRQRALEAVSLLAGRTQRLTRLVELGYRRLAGRLARRQLDARLLQAIVVAGSLGLEPRDVLVEGSQACFTIALAGLIDGQIGLQRLQLLLGARQTCLGFADPPIDGLDLLLHLRALCLGRVIGHHLELQFGADFGELIGFA